MLSSTNYRLCDANKTSANPISYMNYNFVNMAEQDVTVTCKQCKSFAKKNNGPEISYRKIYSSSLMRKLAEEMPKIMLENIPQTNNLFETIQDQRLEQISNRLVVSSDGACKTEDIKHILSNKEHKEKIEMLKENRRRSGIWTGEKYKAVEEGIKQTIEEEINFFHKTSGIIKGGTGIQLFPEIVEETNKRQAKYLG